MKSSTNGTITLTKTGLIHKAVSGAYSGRVAEDGSELVNVDQVKRGRGRPKKDTGSAGAKFDFSAFLSPIVPSWNGPSRVFLKDSK